MPGGGRPASSACAEKGLRRRFGVLRPSSVRGGGSLRRSAGTVLVVRARGAVSLVHVRGGAESRPSAALPGGVVRVPGRRPPPVCRFAGAVGLAHVRRRRSRAPASTGASRCCGPRPRVGAAASAGPSGRFGRRACAGRGRPRSRARRGGSHWCFGVTRSSSMRRGGGLRRCAGAVRCSSGLLRARGSGPRPPRGHPGRLRAPPRAGKRPAPALQGNAVLAHVSGRRPPTVRQDGSASSMSGLARGGQPPSVTSEDGGSALPGRERTSSVHS
ncbi:hypothetical protein SAMN02745830_01757 [Streptomyces sp. Amel2xC10]|nr:hypothetical protein SAMN02745830_01757 [Streptomyces sp. Amel2xC10]